MQGCVPEQESVPGQEGVPVCTRQEGVPVCARQEVYQCVPGKRCTRQKGVPVFSKDRDCTSIARMYRCTNVIEKFMYQNDCQIILNATYLLQLSR